VNNIPGFHAAAAQTAQTNANGWGKRKKGI